MDFDYLVRHHELKSKLVESVGLADLHLKHRLWKNASIWKVGGAVVFRVTEIVEDVDGSARAYHPPTETSWDGYGPGRDLAKDHLGNAVGNPGVTAYAHSKDEKDWALTAGCQLFRDLHKARGLEPKAAPAAQPAGAGSNGPPPTQAAQDARAALDKIYKQYGVTKLSELEAKSLSAVCVLFVEGRDKQKSIADWSHVVSWAGIQTKAGKPVVRAEGNNKGFYIPAITPGWADAEKHPWVVLNPPQD